VRYAILIFSVGALLAIGVFMVGVGRLERALLAPAPGPAVERVVVLPEQASLPKVVSELSEAGLMVDEGWLTLYAERLADAPRLVAGEYALSSELSPILQLERLVRGEVLMHAVDVRPGSTAAEVVRDLAKAGLGEAEALEAALEDEKLIAKAGVEAKTLEGMLLPEVYTMPRGLDPAQVLAKPVQRFADFVAQLPEPTRPLYDVVRVASLLETSDVPRREWKVYAALLFNRLDAKIPLEHPRTAAYGRNRGFAEKDNPYRTDRRPGLPPTPICNPGPDALSAAAAPARTDARYLVRREDGSHYYCPDQECARAAERARKGLPPVLPPPVPPPPPVVAPPPRPTAPPLVVPGQPLDPEPPSEIEPAGDVEQPL